MTKKQKNTVSPEELFNNGRLNINSVELYKELIKDIITNKVNIVAIDTETTGLDTKNVDIFYIPIGYKVNDKLKSFIINFMVSDETKEKMIKLTKNLFNYFIKQNVKIIFHNAVYDLGVIKSNYGIEFDTKNVIDTMYKAIHINTSFLNGEITIDNSSALLSNENEGLESLTQFNNSTLPLRLKLLSDSLDLKGITLEQFDKITASLLKKDWVLFKQLFNDFVLLNGLKLNQLEKTMLKDTHQTNIENNIEWFTQLFVNPEKSVENLKTMIENKWNQSFINFYKQNKTKFKNFFLSDTDLKSKSIYKTSLKRMWAPYEHEEVMSFMRAFHEAKFNVEKKTSMFFSPYLSMSQASNPDISYLDLAGISELVLFVYSVADAKLTIQVNDKLDSIIDDKLNKLFSPRRISKKELDDKTRLFWENYQLDIDTFYGLVEQQFTGMPVDIDTLAPQLQMVKDSITEIGNSLNRELTKILKYVTKNKQLDQDIRKEFLEDFNITDENGKLIPNIKSSQTQKISKIITKYIPWFKMFISVQIKQKDTLAVTTLQKFIDRSKLKYEDYELYEAFIKVNLRKVDETTKAQFDELFDVYGTNGVLIREKLLIIFMNYTEEIFKKLFKTKKQPTKILTNQLKLFVKEAGIENIIQKMFLKFGSEYKLGMSEEFYLDLKTKWYEGYYLSDKKYDDGMTFKERLQLKVIKPYIENLAIRLLKGEVSKDIISSKVSASDISFMNKFVKELGLKSKVPKRTINKETIPQFLSFGKTIDSLKEYDEEQKEVLKAIVEIVRLKTINDTQTKWLMTYGASIGHKALLGNGRFVTSLRWNAETGRGTSSSQQFPNGKLYSPFSEEPQVIFDPRSVFKPPEGKMLVFIDLQNIEVKAANIAIRHYGLIDKAYDDAYVPIGYRNNNGELWDFNNEDHKLNVKKYTWINKKGEVWIPIDLHGELAKTVDSSLVEGTPEFTKMRKLGKKITFGKQYGQSLNGMMLANPDIDKKLITSIYDTLNKIHLSQEQVINALRMSAGKRGYFEAYHGRIFSFPKERRTGKVLFTHKLFNYYCQGMGAIILKRGVRDSYNFSKEHPDIDVKMMNTVHDEIQFVATLDAKNIRALFEYKRLMNTHPDIKFPITSDIEISTYAWGYKWVAEDDLEGNITIELEHTLKDGKNVNIIRTPEEIEACGNTQVDFDNLQNEIGHIIIREKNESGELVVISEFKNNL